MFGYITACEPKLSEEDQRIYKAYYCGLCEELGKRFGNKSKMVLAYDLVFLAVLKAALYETEETFKKGPCLVKFKKTERVSTETLAYAADMNILLAYHNCRDQVHDSKDLKAKALLKLLEKPYQKVSDMYPRQKKAVETYMDKLFAFESNPEDNPDYAGNLTGEMLSEVFLEKEDEFSKYLKPLFFSLGKFIYLMDAYEDMEEDRESGNYNPYSRFSFDPESIQKIQAHLEGVMGICGMNFECLPILKYEELLRNIIYVGVWNAFARVTSKRLKEEK